jgi:hypothetical protein
MKISDAKDLLIIAFVGGVAYWIYKNGDDIVDWFKEKFDPTSDKNVAYQGANAVLQAATQSEETLGTWAYNLLKGNQEYDSYVMSPYTKSDGTRGVRVTQVIRRSDGKVFRVVDGLFGPTLEPV